MSRARETWSIHDKAPSAAPGSPFGSAHGVQPRRSCFKCGDFRLASESVPVARVKGQRKCGTGFGCGPAAEVAP